MCAEKIPLILIYFLTMPPYLLEAPILSECYTALSGIWALSWLFWGTLKLKFDCCEADLELRCAKELGLMFKKLK